MSGVLVLVEHEGGRPDRLSLEALGIAGRLATSLGTAVDAALMGPDADAAAAALGAYGVATAHVVADERLDPYAPAAWASGLAQVVAGDSFDAVIAPGSERGTEILVYVAARSGLPMAANTVEIEPGERWKVVRQRWAGSLLEEAWLDGTPRLMTVAPHAVP